MLAEHGYTLVVASSLYSEDLEFEHIRNLAARGIDALFLIGHHRDPAAYEFLESRGIPVLVAWAHDPSSPQVSVGFDNRAAMAGLAQAAVHLGHRNLGVISARTKSNDRARERVRGILETAAKAGIDAETVQILESAYSFEEGAAQFRHMMTLSPRPTVVFCGNDVIALGALQAAKDMGLAVPEDVSVTGFDDTDLASLAEPKLTNVSVPDREMGRRAAQMTINALKGDAILETFELEAQLNLRESLGPPRGS